MDQRQFDSWYKVGFLASGSNEIGAMPFESYCSSAVCNEYTYSTVRDVTSYWVGTKGALRTILSSAMFVLLASIKTQ